MAIAIDPHTPVRYILEDDRKLPPDQQTVFLLKPLTMRQWLKLVGMTALTDGKVNIQSMDQVINFFTESIVGWENFKLPDGKVISFPFIDGKPDPMNWDYLTISQVSELMEAIIEVSNLNQNDRKN